MAYNQKSNPFKKNRIVKQEGEEEGVKVKTKTKIDEEGNIIWSKTKKKGKLRYKKDKTKKETPPDPFNGRLDRNPWDIDIHQA